MLDRREDSQATEESVVTPSGDEGTALDEQADLSTTSNHDEDATETAETATDEADDLLDENAAPEDQKQWVKQANKALQKKLRAASQASKERDQLREQLAQFDRERAGLAAIMRTKDPQAVLKMLQEQFGSGEATPDHNARFVYKPTKPLPNAEAQEALNEVLNDAMSQFEERLLQKIESRTKPLVEKIGRSEALVKNQEWSKVQAKYGTEVDKWRDEAEQLIASGLPVDKAVMAASNGAARDAFLRRQNAAQKAKGSATPVLPVRGRDATLATRTNRTGPLKLSDYMKAGLRG